MGINQSLLGPAYLSLSVISITGPVIITKCRQSWFTFYFYLCKCALEMQGGLLAQIVGNIIVSKVLKKGRRKKKWVHSGKDRYIWGVQSSWQLLTRPIKERGSSHSSTISLSLSTVGVKLNLNWSFFSLVKFNT